MQPTLRPARSSLSLSFFYSFTQRLAKNKRKQRMKETKKIKQSIRSIKRRDLKLLHAQARQRCYRHPESSNYLCIELAAPAHKREPNNQRVHSFTHSLTQPRAPAASHSIPQRPLQPGPARATSPPLHHQANQQQLTEFHHQTPSKGAPPAPNAY